MIRKLVILLFLFANFSIRAQKEYTSTIDPYAIPLVNIRYNKIIYNSEMNELESHIDSANNLVLKNKLAFVELKVGKKMIKILSLYPNIYFIENDSLYFMDWLGLFNPHYPHDDLTKLPIKENSEAPSRYISNRQYYMQVNARGSLELIIDWTADFNGEEYYSGVKIIDLSNKICIFDVIYKAEVLRRGSVECEECGGSASIEKKVEIFNDRIKINKPIPSKDGGKKVEYIVPYYNLNDFKPAYYRFIKGKFRLSSPL